MATKAQAKAAIDAAVVLIKSDIDNILPSGVNIEDGIITFGPTRWTLVLNAEQSSSTAESLTTSITTNLTSASRSYITKRSGRRENDVTEAVIEVISGASKFRIYNFVY